MNQDPSDIIYPFRGEEAPDRASLFRRDPQSPPIPRMPSLMAPGVAGYRKQKSIRQFYEEWFAGEDLSLEDLYPYRLKVAWRVARALATARGVITSKRQTLLEATRIQPSPWTEPFHFRAHTTADAFLTDICEQRQLPLLPPDIAAVHEDGRVDRGYDPEQDESLLDFIRLTEHVATRLLFVPRTREGRFGMAGLFEPSIARLAWPSAVEIMHFEQGLIEKTYSTMVDSTNDAGDEEAVSSLRVDMDLNPDEILSVLAMARSYAIVATGLDDPESYFLMEIAKLQDLAQRQSSREDFRGAAQTRRDVLRLISARADNDTDEDYDQIVEAEMVKEKKRKRLPPPE